MSPCDLRRKYSKQLRAGVKLHSKCKPRFYFMPNCRMAVPQNKLAKIEHGTTGTESTQDSNKHEGKLKLITRKSVDEGMEKGWGKVVVEEADDMRKRFEEEFVGDEAKLYEYWPQAFR